MNGGSATSTFSVTVVGSPSGDTYGSAMIDVPTRASPQFSLSAIRDLATASDLVNGDTSFALYIQNADQGSGYQHVIFNGDNNFFENASICAYTFDDGLSSISNSKVLTNVHTSRLGPWPSQIEIHNFFNAPVTYLVSVVEALTGTVMGQVNVDTAANASRKSSAPPHGFVIPMPRISCVSSWLISGTTISMSGDKTTFTDQQRYRSSMAL